MAINPDLQNWALWDFDERPNFRVNTGNPTVGFGGGSVYQQIMEQNNQTGLWGMTEDGQMNIFNDDCLTIVGGVTKQGGTCVNIVGKNGDVTITAEQNGDILIKGTNITVGADNNHPEVLLLVHVHLLEQKLDKMLLLMHFLLEGSADARI